MKILFIHQNFPGQYKHLFSALSGQPGIQVVGIGEEDALKKRYQGITLAAGTSLLGYPKPQTGSPNTHHYIKGFETNIRRGQQLARLALDLKKKGFYPDVICAHPGWGEGLFLKDLFPRARWIAFLEFYYIATGADVGFDPEYPINFDDQCRVRVKNTTLNQALIDCDVGLSPTHWQKEVHPRVFHPKINVIHDGVDTELIQPNHKARFTLENGSTFKFGDPIITFVNRNLEPYRGFHTFMRALPRIQAENPDAHVIIVGGNDVSYGRKSKMGSYKAEMLHELEGQLDLSRIHFTGQLPYKKYLRLLQVSAAHVYLTYPFVLSWSMLESMAAGCVVIGSRTKPVLEVIEDGINGHLTDFFDPIEMSNKISEVLQNPAQQHAIRQQARQTVQQRYDLKTICLPAQLKLILNLP